MSPWFSITYGCFACFLLYSTAIHCQETNNNKANDTDYQAGLNYLVRYGYLSAKWLNRTRNSPIAVARSVDGGRNSLDPIKAAVISFQRMANINPTGVIDNVTAEAMRWPRCGVSDANLRNASAINEARRRAASALYPMANYVLFGTKWTTTNLTYTITKYTADIDRDTIDLAINDTLGKWAAVTRLQFVRVTKQPLIEIKWATSDHGDGESFDGPGGILAHSFFPPRRLTLGYGLPGDVHFDDDDSWNVRPSPGRISLAHVSLHETGHAIGLDHTTDRNAVMYPFFTQSAMNRAAKLTQDDIDGIQELYGKPEQTQSATDFVEPSPVLTEASTSTTTTPPPATTTTTTSTPGMARQQATPTTCPYIAGRGISAITQAADQPDATFAIMGSSIYRVNDEGGVYPGFPKPIHLILPNAPPSPISGLVTYIHTGTSFDRRYMYLFKADNYWRYEIRKSLSSLEESDLKFLQGPSLLQILVQQFLLGQQQASTKVAGNARSPSPSRNVKDGNFKLQFILNPGYPKKIVAGFKGINAPGAVIFQLVSDELIYFVSGSQYWTFSPLQSGNSTAAPLAEHPVLKWLPVRPPLLQSAMLYNGRNYFFASNGSYWVWSPSRVNTESESSLNNNNNNNEQNNNNNNNNNNNDGDNNGSNTFTNTKNAEFGDSGRWSMALSISEWWFNCGMNKK